MADFLIEATLSNLVVSTILAVIAWTLQRRVRSPALANLLWALVLIKMVTPPLVAIRVLEVPSISSLSVQQAALSSALNPHMDLRSVELRGHSTDSENPVTRTSDTQVESISTTYGARSVKLGLLVWLVVSAMLLLVSAIRIIRFHWLLKASSRVDNDLSSALSSDVASQLGLGKYPRIFVTAANIAPFVWWMAGRSVIVVSSQATQELNETDLRLVITHEMAHIKRRDHWFRWLEWIALIGLWWNPVMWWARHQLRISEEMACDDLVLETAALEVNQYANSLLNMAELLASPAIRPPVVASAINSGGSLEKRLNMMIAETTWKVPAALRMAIVAVAACVFPLGFIYAQDFKAVERRLGGAVEAGELSLDQANLMMDALRRSTVTREMEAKKQRYMKFAEEIKAAVKAGKLSKAEAEEKLIAVRRKMFEQEGRKDGEQREMDARKQRYMKFAEEIEAAVEAGKLSKEDAEEKLIAMRRKMFEQEGRKDGEQREMDARKQRYMKFAEEIEAAVEAGRLSKEDAEEKLIAVRRKMFEQEGRKDGEQREMDARKQRYMKFAEEIEAAVEAGRLSKEDAEEKLIAMRRKMFEKDGGEKEEDRDIEAKKRKYMEIVREIEAAAEAGKVSREEAEKRIIALRKEIFKQDASKDRDD